MVYEISPLVTEARFDYATSIHWVVDHGNKLLFKAYRMRKKNGVWKGKGREDGRTDERRTGMKGIRNKGNEENTEIWGNRGI